MPETAIWTSALATAAFLDDQLGTSDLAAASTYMEDPLRMTLHLVMSQPEYQLD